MGTPRRDHIDVVAFDADDTLWHSETLFAVTQERFVELLRPYLLGLPDDELVTRLIQRETANLKLFGYGAKGFTLSMIETAIEVTDGNVRAPDVQRLIDFGKDLLDHPVELLDGVHETVRAIAERHQVMVITKGDLLHQESKLAASGLGDLLWRVEIVSEKDPGTYRRILDRYAIEPSRFLMVGNSVRSDVLPVLAIGGHALHIPYEVTWAHEHAEHDGEVVELASIREVLTWLDGSE